MANFLILTSTNLLIITFSVRHPVVTFAQALIMASLQFFKYQGTGNDFIMADNRKGDIGLTTAQIVHLCDRRFGIGSDGIILIEKSDEADFNMNFFNPDGSKSFCGNGSRCAVRFAQKLGIVESSGTFTAIDGLHSFESNAEEVRIHMRDVHSTSTQGEHYIIHTGSPHYIIYVQNLNELDVVAEGRKIRYNDEYRAQGINVNFVQEKDNELHIRTYERGVEDETLSCGTGVTAAALSYALRHADTNQLSVVSRGGLLRVQWERPTDFSFDHIYLCGPAEFVFEGSISI